MADNLTALIARVHATKEDNPKRGITIDASEEASIQMLDNPTNTSTGGTTATTMVSMFQTNTLAIKGVRYVNWTKRRSQAVAFIRRHRPRVVAVAGITAYRRAFAEPGALVGRQPDPLGGAELWVVPNPSGLNAHDTVASRPGS